MSYSWLLLRAGGCWSWLAALCAALLVSTAGQPSDHAHVLRNKLGSFDFAELESRVYKVEISPPKPVGGTEGESGNERLESSDHSNDEESATIEMVSIRGQRHLCKIPFSTASTGMLVAGESPILPNISRIVRGLGDRPCLVKTSGWWTYEYCHGKFIRQYHLEAGKLVGKTLYMGYYANETVWDQEAWDKTQELVNSLKSSLPGSGVSVVYHSVSYDNGTICDLTQLPRRTVVKISCGLGEDKLVTVKETAACIYEVYVNTPLLCDVPIFDSSGVQTAGETLLTCSPLVSQDTYRAYLKKQEVSIESRVDNLVCPKDMSKAKDAFAQDVLGMKKPAEGAGSMFSGDGDFGEDGSAMLRELVSQVLGLKKKPRRSKESERERLLRQLIRKIQPDLTKEGVSRRVAELKKKFEHFELSDLRQLVGSDTEELEEGTAVREDKGVVAGSLASMAMGEGAEDSRGGDTALDELGEEEQSLLDQLDEESMSELESEVTAELNEKLSELGLPTGAEVKLKVFRLDWDDDDDDGDNNDDDDDSDVEGSDGYAPAAETRDESGEQGERTPKKREIKVVQMSLSSSLFKAFGQQGGSTPEEEERRDAASTLLAGYNTVWGENQEKVEEEEEEKDRDRKQ